jgi:pimeloyl-ACP methyl ester carboxylesterase
MTEHAVRTRYGRMLQVCEDGDPRGVPIMSLHGTPGSRLIYAPEAESARAHGIRLITYDRPGYGGSTPDAGRSVADCAADVRAIADALGIRRLAVWGGSGGAPHAAACAALLEDLVPAAGVIASAAPYDAPGLDYFGGMGDYNVSGVRKFLDDPETARAEGRRDREQMLAADAESIRQMMQSLLAPVDAALMTPERAAHSLKEVKLGLAPGDDGWWDDTIAGLGEWGFDVAAIRTPVLVMHGRQDRFVPFAHGEWLAGHIPGAEARLYDDDGHVSLFANRGDEINDWLLERMR